MIFLKSYFVNTTADIDFLPITHDVRYALRDATAKNATVNIVIPSSGASLVIIEPLPEVFEELKVAFELFGGEGGGGEASDKRKERVAISPRVQSTVFGRSLSLPVKDGKLVLDPYNEIYLIDFDKKPRRREFFAQVVTEELPQPLAGPKKAPIKK